MPLIQDRLKIPTRARLNLAAGGGREFLGPKISVETLDKGFPHPTKPDALR